MTIHLPYCFRSLDELMFFPSYFGARQPLGRSMNPRLMHRLSFAADFALSTPLFVAALGAFFCTSADAQNAQQGMTIYQTKCSACHSVDESGVGPAHAGVLGRRAGQAVGYEYSEALSKSKVVWNKTTLNAWLTDPEKVIPGQRMGYRLKSAQERADVIAYLANLT
jgi:cytochrome c